jgi:hypothetical protein
MTRKRFSIAAAALIAFYLAIELAYVIRAPRVMDEFVNAFIVRQLETKLPYRDYAPPKTVLAYYIELPPLLLRDGWQAMTAVKVELALLNVLLLAAAAAVLSRRLRPHAVLASMALLVVMTNYLERSAELRADPIAALLGLASLLCLISRRPLLAGIAAAASFLATQKAIYFVAAAAVALVALFLRDRSRKRIRDLLLFAIGSAGTLALYIASWSAVSSPRRVIASIFFDASVSSIALADFYDIRWKYWSQTLVRNPFFYALAIAGLVMAIRRWLTREPDDVIDVIAPYAFTITLLCVWHKQPWPYFFVFLVPTLFVLNAATIDDLLARSRPRVVLAFATAFALFGLLLPLSRIPHALARDSGFQHAMFDAGEQLLGPGETYVDGISILYRHEQALPMFAWLDAMALQHLREMRESELRALAGGLPNRPPKLLIWNDRIAGLPPGLLSYFATQFRPVYGNLFLYAPIVAGSQFVVHFDGGYRVEGAEAAIDGVAVKAGAVLQLKRGVHSLVAEQPLRLRLLPPAGIDVDPRYAGPHELFPNVYDF